MTEYRYFLSFSYAKGDVVNFANAYVDCKNRVQTAKDVQSMTKSLERTYGFDSIVILDFELLIEPCNPVRPSTDILVVMGVGLAISGCVAGTLESLSPLIAIGSGVVCGFATMLAFAKWIDWRDVRMTRAFRNGSSTDDTSFDNG